MGFEIMLAALAGGFAGLLLAAVFDPNGRMDAVFLVGGAAVGITVGRLMLLR